ncbi:MAG: hypothetical protein ACRD1V_01540, partial [Vicinamibacterales bacterium]
SRPILELRTERDQLAQVLAHADEARQQAKRQSASELTAAAGKLADLQAQHTATLAREARICSTLQDRLFELERAQRTNSDRSAADAAAFAEQLAKRHAAFTSSLAQATHSRDAFAAQLSVVTTALEDARDARRADRTEAADQLRRREADLAAAQEDAASARTTLEGALADAGTTRAARQRAEIALVAANDQLASLQAQYDGALAAHARAQAALERQSAETASALEQMARERASDAAAARTALEGALADAGTTRDARQRAEIALVAANEQLANLQAQYDGALAAHARAQAALERQSAETASALDQMARERASDAAAARTALDAALADAESIRGARQRADIALVAANDQLADLQAQYGGALAANVHAHAALERQSAEAASALEQMAREGASDAAAARTALDAALADADSIRDAQQRAETALVTANEQLSALEALLAQETERRDDLEQTLATANADLRRADEQRIAKLSAADGALANLQARYDAARAEHAEAHVAFERQSADAAAALEQVGRDRASDAAEAAERLARREAEFTATVAASAAREAEVIAAVAEGAAREAALVEQLTRESGARAELVTAVAEGAVREAALAEQLTRESGARAELVAAVADGTAREAALVERLTRESDARAALENSLDAVRLENTRARRQSLRVLSAYRRRSLEEKARLEAELGTTHEQLEHLHVTIDDERRAYERVELTNAAEIERVSAEYGQLRRSFDGLEAAFQTLEQVAAEHAAERSKLEGTVADRDKALAAQTARHRASEQAAEDAFGELQTRLQQTLDARGADIARLEREIDALREALAAAVARGDRLQPDADCVPHLRTELQSTQRERRREFERAPYALCRCTEAGVITDANHSFVTLLGRRRVEDVRSLDFRAAVSDAAGDLGWLLERTRAVRKTETIETKWKTADGRRLIVRLRALATTTGSIDVVVEDITAVRMLEERLRQSQRLEAVGRLASEVAVTCDVLIRDVTRGAREWLAAVGGDAARSRQGERLLTDLGRAASFLRQLGAYGHTQIRALEPVSVQRVLQNLAPVLKRVVGDRIELVLSKSSNRFEVDVDAERIERVLVNVAGYARQRMPGGGQMKIELSTTAVGRRFVARYPHVRPGDHVLVTVSEVPVDAASDYRVDGDTESSESPGVDLGGLVDLVGSCGGHLWMEAQPAGNLMLKIHLPKRAAGDASGPREADGHRGSRLTRWFRSSSAAIGTRA